MYKVVLVDDEHLILEGLKRVVPWEKMGCCVTGTASDGMSGMQLIRETAPDIVFTDIRMPNMDGLTMLAALKSEYPHMQVTVLTALPRLCLCPASYPPRRVPLPVQAQ